MPALLPSGFGEGSGMSPTDLDRVTKLDTLRQALGLLERDETAAAEELRRQFWDAIAAIFTGCLCASTDVALDDAAALLRRDHYVLALDVESVRGESNE